MIVPDELQCFGTVRPVNSGFGGGGGSLGTYLGGRGGEGGGTAVHIRASSRVSGATWYGVEWGLGRGLGEVGARMGGGGEGGCVGNGGSGEANSPRHFSALESHGGDAGWSPNRKSSGKSPQASRKEGLEGTEEATLRGLDDMAS